MNYPLIRQAIATAKVVELSSSNQNPYLFCVFAFGEKGSYLTKELIEEVTGGLSESILQNFNDVDYLMSPAPGGHMWGSLVALRMGKDLNSQMKSDTTSQYRVTDVREFPNRNHWWHASPFGLGRISDPSFSNSSIFGCQNHQ